MIFIVITIFALSLIASFGILSYSAWEVRAGERPQGTTPVLKLSFKKVEKYAMYIAKHLIQSLVLFIVKTWLLGVAKTRKWLAERWPRMRKILKKKQKPEVKPTFVQKAVIESKTKIKRIKEKIKKEHEI